MSETICILTGSSLTLEVRFAAHHEELYGLDLAQVTVLVLLLGVAVGPVCAAQKRLAPQGDITYITHERPLAQPLPHHSSARATSGCSRSRSPEQKKKKTQVSNAPAELVWADWCTDWVHTSTSVLVTSRNQISVSCSSLFVGIKHVAQESTCVRGHIPSEEVFPMTSWESYSHTGATNTRYLSCCFSKPDRMWFNKVLFTWMEFLWCPCSNSHCASWAHASEKKKNRLAYLVLRAERATIIW